MKSDKMVVIYDPVDRVYYSKRTHGFFDFNIKEAKIFHSPAHAKSTITSNLSSLKWCYKMTNRGVVTVEPQGSQLEKYNRWERCEILHIGNITVNYFSEPKVLWKRSTKTDKN